MACMTCTVMEAERGMPYRLRWKRLLSCELYCQRHLLEFVVNHPSPAKSLITRQVSTLRVVYPYVSLVPPPPPTPTCIFIGLPIQRQKPPTKNSHNYTKSTVYCVSQLMDLWSLCTNSLGSISGMCF